ncbi:T9SS type A sorting domain-containing protein [Flavobacterium sp. NRK F10]|uniref:M1 family aminopeptidase n=1 Tax=Flavobacterium sp. NRK F10 TaxID=2954931 RepID=UPI002090A428|nr:M1 family aminopeptidase [Flavobacterium sp. NRK F10]MCO6174139.1 T9SS type A sorting domain-containing protein [Flavobacterium sp. NRK F10]
MKKLYLIMLLVLGFVAFAQTEQEEFNRMVEAEMKSAAAIQNFQVNPNTQNYDITYHELRFSVDPAVYFISGQVTTTFTALEDMNSITFDLTDVLTVSSVTLGGVPLTFTQNVSEELVINLPTTIINGTSATITINYSGAPDTDEAAFTATTHSGTPVIYTLSEPFGARDWWPCKQDLNDKVDSIDVYITAPDTYVSVTNGLEQSVVDNGNGTKTTHFHHGHPIPAYLVAIAVTNYQIYTQTAGIGTTFPIVNYIYPENYTTAQTQLAETLPIMNVFETLFEPYPFLNEKYGHAQFGWGGGMEHTTVSFMGSFGRNLIAHELAHQWFGDKITCGTWKDIWLNEGFAEYLSGLIVENLDGVTNFVSWKASKISNITSQVDGAVYLTDTEATNVSRIFSGRLSYNKGAMVLHMLRWKMGDALFFQALQNYLADANLAYAYAITPQLQSHLEAVYGSSLTEFFNDWIYNQGYPSYTITAQNWGAGQAKITVNQSQSTASVTYFEMPLEIRLLGAGGEIQDVVVDNTYNGQEFVVAVPFVVSDVEFDPNYHIISRNNTATLGTDSFTIDESITLYPNPVQDVLTIKMPNSMLLQNVTIYNDLGQKVLESEQSEIDLTVLADGMYAVKLQTSEGEIHKKLIKK